MKKPQITIDVVSDVVCPWCYIGKRRLEKAIEKLQDQYDIAVSFLPFELNPGMAPGGVDQKAYLSAKFGGDERYEQLTGHVTEIARQEGLTFDYSKQKVSPNTRDAHRIIWLARKTGKQNDVKEALLKAYFEQGIDLSKKENLVRVAVGAGLLQQEVTNFLNSSAGIAEVALAEQTNLERGVTGVPFYIINKKYGVSGAQPTETFEKLLTGVGEEIALRGDACATDGSDC